MKRTRPHPSAWLKLKSDGDSARIVFLGPPYKREICFINGQPKPFNAAMAARGLKPKMRVSINVNLFDSVCMHILDMNRQLFKHVSSMRWEYPLDTWAFELQRAGAAGSLDTTYSMRPFLKLTAKQRHASNRLPRYPLKTLYGKAAGSTIVSWD